MKTYKIKLENNKYNVYYFIDGELETKEFHSIDGVNGTVRDGYIKEIDYTNITEFKNYLYSLVDSKSMNKIFEGFMFENNLFSMSLSAQINWSNLLLLPEQVYPIKISCKDEGTYTLDYANRINFYMTCVQAKNIPLQDGTIIKTKIKNSTTITELEKIKSGL